MKQHGFFAYVFRMRYIARWALMRNTRTENVEEHSYEVAVLAHALAVIGRDVFHKDVNPDRAATAALFHDAPEIITGDLPTPVKYRNPEIKNAYQDIETRARQRLCEMLPEDLRADFVPYIQPDESGEIWQLVKAADRLSAYIKCLTEEKLGNGEFAKAKETILESLKASPLPEVQDFLAEFVPSYTLTPDELSRG
jgi:5'-deoxynucleotidase